MKGLIYKLIDNVTGKLKFPISVTSAIYEGNKTQKEINSELASKQDRGRFVNQAIHLFAQGNHRGGVNYPENTLPAFEHSIKESKFDYVECDVRVTSDSKFVALHDETINRTSDGTGAVNYFTYSQLQNYDFGSWKSSQFSGTKIPLISDIALLCKKNRVVLEIDCAGRLNSTQICALYDEISELGMLNSVVFCGFENELKWLYDNNKKDVAISVSFMNTTPTVTLINTLPPYLSEFAAVNVSINKNYMDADIVAAAHRKYFNVKTWTVTDSSELSKLAKLGADLFLIDSDVKYTI